MTHEEVELNAECCTQEDEFWISCELDQCISATVNRLIESAVCMHALDRRSKFSSSTTDKMNTTNWREIFPRLHLCINHI